MLTQFFCMKYLPHIPATCAYTHRPGADAEAVCAHTQDGLRASAGARVRMYVRMKWQRASATGTGMHVHMHGRAVGCMPVYACVRARGVQRVCEDACTQPTNGRQVHACACMHGAGAWEYSVWAKRPMHIRQAIAKSNLHPKKIIMIRMIGQGHCDDRPSRKGTWLPKHNKQ